MFYHIWTMKKPMEEVQQGTTVTMSITEYTIRKLNRVASTTETSNSTPFHTTTKQSATELTIPDIVAFDELYKTHAGLRKLIPVLEDLRQNMLSYIQVHIKDYGILMPHF